MIIIYKRQIYFVYNNFYITLHILNIYIFIKKTLSKKILKDI